MRDAWTREAPNWLQLVRSQLDAGWTLSSPQFLKLVPAPGELTLDIGCGEGRMAERSPRPGMALLASTRPSSSREQRPTTTTRSAR
jgi:hypothetical protein